MIVVDTNIICYYWLRSPLSSQAEALLQIEPEWTVPLLWRSEFRNALALGVRHQVITMKDAIDLIGRAESLLHGCEMQVSSRMVMDLVSQSTCTAYDCEFVAVARERGLRLVTMDKQVLREFAHIAVSLPEFLAS